MKRAGQRLTAARLTTTPFSGGTRVMAKRKSRGKPRGWNQQSYRQRDETLKKMGFSTYQDYLADPMWGAIKRRCLQLADGKCKICGKAAQTAHHIGYGKDTLLGLNQNALVAVCGRCHRKIEFDKDMNKRTLQQSQHALQTILKNLHRQ